MSPPVLEKMRIIIRIWIFRGTKCTYPLGVEEARGEEEEMRENGRENGASEGNTCRGNEW